MASPLDSLAALIHSGSLDGWKKNNEEALAALFGSRYPKNAEQSVTLRAPDMRGDSAGVPYAAYIHPSNADSGPYGGMSFVIFPSREAPCLVAMGIGTHGLSPDEAILGRPGHARKMQAICSWLNHRAGGGRQIAWAKNDPTRTDIDLPSQIQRDWPQYEQAFKRYGKVLYAIYIPTGDRAATVDALAAMLDVMFEERGHSPMAAFKTDSSDVRAKWFAHLMPSTKREDVVDLLERQRFVVIQGPPGTGKTRMAREILVENYQGNGQSVQFHPNTTYENFVGGLAPDYQADPAENILGFRFAPKPGFLLEAAALATNNPTQKYLLHIDEINRADLGKVLGEAIYLLESDTNADREITLPYDFGTPFGRTLRLPHNLHILGTMNTADRSIAILDVAVRRRFAFVSLWPNSGVVNENSGPLGREAFEKLTSIFVENASDDGLALVPGHSYFLSKDDAEARVKLKTSLMPLLSEYLAQGYISGFAEPVRAFLQWVESR